MDEKDTVGAVEIGGRTRLCGLIGNPVEHTLSPMIHNTLAAACGCDMAYLPFLVEKEGLGAAVKGAYALNVLGLNVTVPYKMAVIPYLVSADKLAADVESVNTLVRTEGGYRGYNTDMSGLYRAMQEDKVEIKDRDVVILGAGGVGRAIAFLCAQKGAERVTILNRSVDKACSVAEEVKEKTGYQAIHARTIAEAGRLDGRDYLAIQATSVGLFPDSEKAAVEDSAFYEKVGTGYDLIYRPAETKFMRLVKENGKEYLVIRNYEHYKQSGKAVSFEEDTALIGELHGGATPEEALVPVMVFTSNIVKHKSITFTVKQGTSWKRTQRKTVATVQLDTCVENLSAVLSNEYNDCHATCKRIDNSSWELTFVDVFLGKANLKMIADGQLLTQTPVVRIEAAGLSRNDDLFGDL